MIRKTPLTTASLLSKILQCPYFAWYERDPPAEPNPNSSKNPGAELGRNAHKKAAEALKYYFSTGQHFKDWGDDPMVRHCAEDFYWRCICYAKDATEVFIEESLDVSDFLGSGHPRVDFACLKLNGTLVVLDLKTTDSHYIDAKDNEQLMAYAAALLTDKVKAVRLEIVQPRLQTVDLYDYKSFEIFDWKEYFVKPVVRAIRLLKIKRKGDHCMGCHADCPFRISYYHRYAAQKGDIL